MPAYIVVSIDIHDPEAMKVYSARVPAVIKAFGGRYLARGEQTTTVEGEFPLSKITLLEFPSLEAAYSFWNSAEYKECKALRENCSSGRAAILAGTAGEAPTPGYLRGRSDS